jgi:hypothetical protein
VFGSVPRAGELNGGDFVDHLVVRKSVLLASAVFVACLAVAGSHLAVAKAHSASDPPLLVPWNRVGNILLGEPRARVEREYGSTGHGYHVLAGITNGVQGYYLLHGGVVGVDFRDGRVEEINFGIRYYRTKSGFGAEARSRSARATRPLRIGANTAGTASFGMSGSARSRAAAGRRLASASDLSHSQSTTSSSRGSSSTSATGA